MLDNQFHDLQFDKSSTLKVYLEKFKNYIDYKQFKEMGFSIGSGESERAHKYITKKRLKLPGTWWLVENVNLMLSLSIIKHNGWWNEF